HSLLSLYSYRAHPHLHSFPTRRSSDLSIWHPRSVGVKSGPFGGMRTPELEFEKPEEVYSFCGSNSVWYVSLGGAADHMGQKLYTDRKSTRLNSSHVAISYAVFCLKKKK